MKADQHIETLKALGVFEAFERNLKMRTLNTTIQEYIDSWKYKDHITFQIFVSDAFPWARTPEGLPFWLNIANS